jgi:hypothetical protein
VSEALADKVGRRTSSRLLLPIYSRRQLLANAAIAASRVACIAASWNAIFVMPKGRAESKRFAAIEVDD